MRIRAVVLCVFFSAWLETGPAHANPTAGKVVAGSGSVVHTSDSRLDVVQNSERLGIEWRDFSIGRGEQVHFDQPSRSAIALNRVTGPRLSDIEGSLTANGNVFLVNRNGVIFHKSATVDVGGLLATTVDISNKDFVAGRYAFTRDTNSSGRIVNEGTIRVAEAGLIALVAPTVRNAGAIDARLGRVALASGHAFTLDLFGDELVSFAVDDRAIEHLAGPDGARVDQSGTIDAPGGRVWLSVEAAREVVDNAINLSGVVRARTVADRRGRIVLSGGRGGVEVTGTLEAGGGTNRPGGDIEVLGASVHLAPGATLEASGGTGGGTVLVGGGFQGQGARQRAVRTTVDAGATVRADATVNGDGGTIVVWSDEHTVSNGTLSARGGPRGGDGGLVETSSAGELEFGVPVKVSAPKGRAGTWLLDPEDIDIGRSQADSIEAALNEGGNVSIQTSEHGDGEGNIAVNASITKTDGDDARLSLTAHGRLDVNKPIRSEAGKLDVSLRAGKDVNVKAGIETNGGKFSSRVTGVKVPKAEPEQEPADSNEDTLDTAASEEPAETDAEAMQLAGADADNKDPSGDDDANPDTGETGSGDEPGGEGIESVQHVASTAAPPAQTSTSELPMIRVEDTVATRGGEISVDAGETGTALVTGRLDASNLDEAGTGGDIEVLGRHVVVAGDAVVDASGEAGGGDIHIGGDYQGQGSRHNAETTTVGDRVVIRSDTTGDGDAGTVVVWADETTRFGGHISARGGPGGGDGGKVEVSGKRNLGFRGTVDTQAPKGTPGSLLLDPETLTIIDAERGEGELDTAPLCTADTARCWLPPAELIGKGDWTLELLDFYGIEPFPNTDLNTLSWGRIMQLADATGFGLYLEADQDVTFAALDGTLSTPGSPAGDNDGWTITLPLNDAFSPAFTLEVTSLHGDILFEDPGDNLAVLGGGIWFKAPEGDLRIGNLYGLGRPVAINSSTPTGWSFGYVRLDAGGDIETGSINTRTVPARFADPLTGAPVPQELLIPDPSTFDVSPLITPRVFIPDPNYPAFILNDPAPLSDFARGGTVFIKSTGGNVNLLGPVYTATGSFIADAAGNFAATNIDTGANRIVVKTDYDDPGSLNTLNTGIAEITADKITFDRINAGQVVLNARSYAENAITGEIVFDTFRNSDFIGGRPETEGIPFLSPIAVPGLILTVGDDAGGTCSGDCVNMVFNLTQLGGAATLGLNSGDDLFEVDLVLGVSGMAQQELGPGFNFSGGDIAIATQHVPLAMVEGPLVLNLDPSPVPISVPLGLSPSPPAAPSGGVGLAAAPVPDGQTPGGGDAPPVTFVETETSSAEIERVRSEGSEEKRVEELAECTDADILEWFNRNPRSVARDLDWGRRAGVGAGPADTDNVFRQGNCYFTSAAGTGDPSLDN